MLTLLSEPRILFSATFLQDIPFDLSETESNQRERPWTGKSVLIFRSDFFYTSEGNNIDHKKAGVLFAGLFADLQFLLICFSVSAKVPDCRIKKMDIIPARYIAI